MKTLISIFALSLTLSGCAQVAIPLPDSNEGQPVQSLHLTLTTPTAELAYPGEKQYAFSDSRDADFFVYIADANFEFTLLIPQGTYTGQTFYINNHTAAVTLTDHTRGIDCTEWEGSLTWTALEPHDEITINATCLSSPVSLKGTAEAR